VARHYRAVEVRAKVAFDRLGQSPTRVGEAMRIAQRFHGWFDRQLNALAVEKEVPREPAGLSPGMER
jgi:hypothetical protein